MCRPNSEGGRRCYDHSEYSRLYRNLNAKKQYHNRRGNTALAAEAESEAQQLIASYNALKVDGGTLLPYTMKLTPVSEQILSQLRDDGFEPYIVGGSVRDALMGKDSKDIDIEVYKASAEDVVTSLRKIGKVDEVGKSFGVLKITVGTEDFDVSLPRVDSKTGDGHTGFEVQVDPDLSIYEATSRRDYTINAMMYDHHLGYIIDKHGGLEDMKAGYLRHVSDAFDEDPLRVLRGVQMASRFNMELHPDTLEKAQTLKGEYSHIAKERVQIEFQKMWDKGHSPDKAFQLLYDTGWSDNFPGMAEIEDREQLKSQLRKAQTLIEANSLDSERKQVLVSSVIATQMKDIPAHDFLSVTTVGDTIKNRAYQLSRVTAPEELNDSTVRHWAKNIPRGLSLNDYSLLQESLGNTSHAEQVRTAAQKAGVLHENEKDIVNGDDVLKLYPDRKPGKWMKKVLEGLRDAQYSNIFRNHSDGVAWLEQNKGKF